MVLLIGTTWYVDPPDHADQNVPDFCVYPRILTEAREAKPLLQSVVTTAGRLRSNTVGAAGDHTERDAARSEADGSMVDKTRPCHGRKTKYPRNK